MNKKKTEKVTTAHPKHKAHTDIVPIEETDNLVKTAETTPPQPAKTTKTESSAQDAEKIETAAQARDADLLKENLINRQLEMLWANGRKQLLNEPSRQSKK